MKSVFATLVLVSLAARAEPVSAPLDVGIGPAASFFFGRLMQDQTIQTGLKINFYSVLDQEWLRDHSTTLPDQYRSFLKGVDEVQLPSSIFIPDSVFISPKVKHTGIYGVTWKPLSLGLPLMTGTVRVRLATALVITYAYVDSDIVPSTHFIRPGAEAGLDIRIKITPSFFVSLGWESQLYVPQQLGGFGFGTADNWICHIGQAYLQVHFRLPHETTL